MPLTTMAVGEVSPPRLLVTAPTDGIINLAVSGFADFDFIGNHAAIGDYELTLTPVPLPGAAWLFGAGLAGIGFVGRRRG